jgi:hypothetical protein
MDRERHTIGTFEKEAAMNYSTMKVGALGLVVVALLAFAVPALAGIRPDDRSGLRGDTAATGAAGVRPDDRAGFRGVVVSSPSTSVRPDDRAGSRGIVPETQRIAFGGRHFVPGTERGFDWVAAGAGAGTATAMVLLVGWALMLRRNHRRAEAHA